MKHILISLIGLPLFAACKVKTENNDPSKCFDANCAVRLADSFTLDMSDPGGAKLKIEVEPKTGASTYASVEMVEGKARSIKGTKTLSVAQRESLKHTISEHLKQLPFTFTNCPQLKEGPVASITSKLAGREVLIYNKQSTQSVCPEVAYVVTDDSFAKFRQDLELLFQTK